MSLYEKVNLASVYEDRKLEGLKDILPWKLNLVALSKDGTKLFLAENKDILVYSVTSKGYIEPGPPFKRLRGKETNDSQDASINSIRIGQIGREEILACVDSSGGVRLYFVRNLTRAPLEFQKRGIAVSANNHRIIYWDMYIKSFLESDEVDSSASAAQKYIDERAMLTDTQFIGHLNNIPSLETCIVSCSIDRTCRLWNLKTREQIISKQIDSDWGWAVKFIPEKAIIKISTKDVQSLKRLDLDRAKSCRNHVEGRMRALLALLSTRGPNSIHRQLERETEEEDSDSHIILTSSVDTHRIPEQDDNEDIESFNPITTSQPFNQALFQTILNNSRRSSSSLQEETYIEDGYSSDSHMNELDSEDHESSFRRRSTSDVIDPSFPQINHDSEEEEADTEFVQDSDFFRLGFSDDEIASTDKTTMKSESEGTSKRKQDISCNLSEERSKHADLTDLILYSSAHNIHLLDRHLNCLASINHVISHDVPLSPILSQFDRLSLLHYIPELSLVVVASQSGHVSLLRLVRYALEATDDSSPCSSEEDQLETSDGFAFIREYQLPNQSRCTSSPLIGMSISKSPISDSLHQGFSFHQDDCGAFTPLRSEMSYQCVSRNLTHVGEESLVCFRIHLVYYDCTICCYELRRSSTLWELSSVCI